MNNRNLILFAVITFLLFSCKSEIEKPKAEYNQKANELIEQLISEGNCECILEIPEESMIEIDSIENPYFNSGEFYIKKLALKDKKELDSLNNLSKKFVLNTKILKRSNIKIIKRDSLRILNKDINFYTKTCRNLNYLIKPIFNKQYDFAIVEYGEVGYCTGPFKTFFEFKNGKWRKTEK